MQDPNALQLPYLLRDMLRFEGAVAFSLRIRSQAASGQNLTIRGMTREGTFTFTHLPNSNETTKEEDFRIPDLPIFLSVTNAAGTYIVGQCYVSIGLVANGDLLYELAAGFIHSARGVSFPATALQDPGPPTGAFLAKVGTNPAAGVEISEVVPTGQHWRLRGVRFQFVTSGTVASRRVHLNINIGQGPGFDMFAEIDQTASQTREYTCLPLGAVQDSSDDDDIIIAIPDNLILMQGSEIRTQTVNLQVGDDFGIPYLWVEKFYRLQP